MSKFTELAPEGAYFRMQYRGTVFRQMHSVAALRRTGELAGAYMELFRLFRRGEGFKKVPRGELSHSGWYMPARLTDEFIRFLNNDAHLPQAHKVIERWHARRDGINETVEETVKVEAAAANAEKPKKVSSHKVPPWPPKKTLVTRPRTMDQSVFAVKVLYQPRRSEVLKLKSAWAAYRVGISNGQEVNCCTDGDEKVWRLFEILAILHGDRVNPRVVFNRKHYLESFERIGFGRGSPQIYVTRAQLEEIVFIGYSAEAVDLVTTIMDLAEPQIDAIEAALSKNKTLAPELIDHNEEDEDEKPIAVEEAVVVSEPEVKAVVEAAYGSGTIDASAMEVPNKGGGASKADPRGSGRAILKEVLIEVMDERLPKILDERLPIILERELPNILRAYFSR